MENKKPTLYAMVGAIGAGKTIYAKKLSTENKALFFSIDKHIKLLGQSINSGEDYDKYYYGVRDVISDYAHQSLTMGISVVLDFGGSVGHWEWLKALSMKSNSNIEIFHLIAPIDVRRERVRMRNVDPEGVFRFSDEAFNSMPQEGATPDVVWPGLKITVINSSSLNS